MSEIDVYLSAEFVAFSENVNRLNKQKSKLKQDLKDFFDKIQLEIKQVEESAEKLVADFETWKNSGIWNSKSESVAGRPQNRFRTQTSTDPPPTEEVPK